MGRSGLWTRLCKDLFFQSMTPTKPGPERRSITRFRVRAGCQRPCIMQPEPMMDFSRAHDRLARATLATPFTWTYPSKEHPVVRHIIPRPSTSMKRWYFYYFTKVSPREEHRIIHTGKWASRTTHTIKDTLSFSMRCQSLPLLHSPNPSTIGLCGIRNISRQSQAAPSTLKHDGEDQEAELTRSARGYLHPNSGQSRSLGSLQMSQSGPSLEKCLRKGGLSVYYAAEILPCERSTIAPASANISKLRPKSHKSINP